MRIGEEKQVHLDNEDPFEYKNSEHQEFFNNISAFDNSGHLGDYVEHIEDALTTDDANLEALIENTTEER